MLRAVLLLHFASVLALGPMALAQTKKPPLPPGRDPGGVAIALLTTGIDYALPHIAQRLARDGEGELIGFDLVDNDNRPFGGDGTTLATHLLDPAIGARLVPVRVDPHDPASLARAVAFIAQTPARIVVVPMWGQRKEDWRPFQQAVEHFSQLLFVVAAGDDGRDLDRDPVYPAALALPNVLVVSAARADPDAPRTVQLLPATNWGANTVDAAALAEDSVAAAAVAAKAAAAMLPHSPRLNGAELKLRLIQTFVIQRQGETPQRTRSLAVLAPMVLRQGITDPSQRILDKARVPERLQEPGPSGPRPRDGKMR